LDRKKGNDPRYVGTYYQSDNHHGIPEIRGQKSEVGQLPNICRLVSHADQFGKGIDDLQNGLRTCDEGIRGEQKLSGGGEICLDWSNSSVITFGMSEPA
jgi:hypothetical protein